MKKKILYRPISDVKFYDLVPFGRFSSGWFGLFNFRSSIRIGGIYHNDVVGFKLLSIIIAIWLQCCIPETKSQTDRQRKKGEKKEAGEKEHIF